MFYVELCVATFLSIRNLEFKGIYGIINCAISIFMCALLIGVLVIFWIIITKANKKRDNQEEFDKKFGALYIELDSDKKYLSDFYYLIFTIRGAILILILFTLNGFGIFQMILIIILNFASVLYLLIGKPFKLDAMNFCSIMNEMSMSIIFIMMIIFVSDISRKLYDKLDLGLFYLIYGVFGFQSLICIGYLIKVFKEKVRLRKSKTQTLPATNPFEQSEIDRLNENRNSIEIENFGTREKRKPLRADASNLEKNSLEEINLF